VTRVIDVASPTAGASYLVAVASIATGRESLVRVRGTDGEIRVAMVPAALVDALSHSGIELCACGAAVHETAPGDWCTIGSGDYHCPRDHEGGHMTEEGKRCSAT
jgi:hypothetical protein